MELPLSCIERRVQKIKKNIFSSNFDVYSFVSSSTYDTAWLAMIPDSKYPSQPMFKSYLEWLINNQKPEGFWGESDTIECLPVTIVSMVALTKWNTGTIMVEKGRSFISANIDKLLNEVKEDCPRWIAIVLPAMIELAHIVGLNLLFPQSSRDTMSSIINRRKSFLNKEDVAGNYSCYPPLLSYLEALPPTYVDEKDICENLSEDGSLFQSPSATAKAFMDYGNKKCLAYLQSLAQRCPKAVPRAYPMDEDHIKLGIANQLHKFGLAQYFVGEIDVLLSQIYRNYTKEQISHVKAWNINLQIQKDALAFELLRTYGFKVSPLRFCLLLNHKDVKVAIENNYEHFSSAMLHVFRASNLIFCGEYELDKARTFSMNILEKIVSTGKGDLLQQIEHELSFPWFARLDHLEHRVWIEETEANVLWKGKTPYNRVSVSCLYNDKILQLATLNFEFKQLIFKNELKELKRWAEKYGMSDMGFGREKSIYCYFAVAASLTSLPHDSYVRMLVAKSAIIITIADDFFDSVGSINQLEILTKAVQRWDSRGLCSHSKVIFDALDNLVSEASGKYFQQEGTTDDISGSLKDLWYEIFLSWLIEANWSRNGHKPSIDCYLKTGMTSIGAHILVLSSSCFLKPAKKLRLTPYEPLTKLLMIISRLLNDVESYQKEKEEGKLNYVLLNMMENPEFEIEDSIGLVREIVEKKKKEFLELVLMDGLSDFPKSSKQLHLSCLKVFQMFFNSKNRFDSNTDLVEDINKAIYLPLSRTSKCVSPQTFPKKNNIISKLHMDFPFKTYSKINFSGMRLMTAKFGFGFI